MKDQKEYKTLEDVEETLNELPLIRFVKQIEPSTLREVINLAIETGLSTYYSKTSKKHCDSGRMRGLADLYRLSRYYIPKVKLRDVIKEVNKSQTYRNDCCTTNQDVFRKCNYGYKNQAMNATIRLKNRKKIQLPEY